MKSGKSSPSYKKIDGQSREILPNVFSTAMASGTIAPSVESGKEMAADQTGLEATSQPAASACSHTQTICGVLLDIEKLIIQQSGVTLSLAPGSRELIQRLKHDGFQFVVASLATSEELSAWLKAAQVEDLLSAESVTTVSNAETAKPATNLIQLALEKAQLQPRQVIMLGDTPDDIESAGKAGVSVIAFRYGRLDDAQLKGALAIYDSPADLLAHYAESPFGRALARAIAR